METSVRPADPNPNPKPFWPPALPLWLPRDGYGVGCNGRSSRSGRLSSTGGPALEEDGIFINSMSSKLLERAQGILL